MAQPASASTCERINAEFNFVKDRTRNKLSHEKANKLVALFHNLRLMKRTKKVAYTEPAVGWSDDLERDERAALAVRKERGCEMSTHDDASNVE